MLGAAIVDIRLRSIPNSLVATMAGVWVAWRLSLGAVAVLSVSPSLKAAAVAESASEAACQLGEALLFALCLLLFVVACERRSDRYLFGGGDVKLTAALALFLGIDRMLACLFAACLVSLVYALAQHAQTRLAFASAFHSEGATARGIPFAPCLAGGYVLALLL